MKSNWGFCKVGHFPYQCLIMYGTDTSQLIKGLRRHGNDTWADILEEFADITNLEGLWGKASRQRYPISKKSDDYFFIALPSEIKLNDRGYTIIAHECQHIVQFVSKLVRADMVRELESSAYLLQHLMDECIKVIREAK